MCLIFFRAELIKSLAFTLTENLHSMSHEHCSPVIQKKGVFKREVKMKLIEHARRRPLTLAYCGQAVGWL